MVKRFWPLAVKMRRWNLENRSVRRRSRKKKNIRDKEIPEGKIDGRGLVETRPKVRNPDVVTPIRNALGRRYAIPGVTLSDSR